MAYAGSASGLNVLLYAMAQVLKIEWDMYMLLSRRMNTFTIRLSEHWGTDDIYVQEQPKGNWESVWRV